MRSTFKAAGGKGGRSKGGSGVCTRCGRAHPKGKKQRKRAMEAGWSCKRITNNDSGPSENRFSPLEYQARQNKNVQIHERNLAFKQQKQNEAIKRHKEYNSLSVEQKIARLDDRLGIGVGAKKERAKLNKQLLKKDKPE